MIRYPGFSFASAPRTASTWFIHAAECIGLGVPTNPFDKHMPDSDSGRLIKVTLVRRPIDWLESMFYSVRGGQIGVDPIDAVSTMVRDFDDFPAFLYAFIDSHHTVAAAFDVYRADICLRVEDLPWAAGDFFGGNVDPGVVTKFPQRLSKVVALPVVNARKHLVPKFSNQHIIRELFDKEREFCERYEYY